MEKIGYTLLLVVAAVWLIFMVTGLVAAFPVGVIGLLALAGFGCLFAKAVRDRLRNREDDHYSKTVEK